MLDSEVVSDMRMQLVDMIILITFVVVTICGLIGKGPIFTNDNVHKSKKAEYVKNVRLFALIDGPLGILSVVLLWIPANKPILAILSWVCFGLALIGVILLMVYCYRVSEQYVNKKSKK